MKTYSLADIDALEPCTNPREFVAEDWSGTLLDILNVEKVKPDDRIWVVTQLLEDKTRRRFAMWCACESSHRSEARSLALEAALNSGWSLDEVNDLATHWDGAGSVEDAEREKQIEKLKEMVREVPG